MSKGIIRKVDELGRIVIPVEIRNKLNIQEKDEVEIILEGRRVILEKYQQDCIICGEVNNLKKCGNKFICKNVFQKLRIHNF